MAKSRASGTATAPRTGTVVAAVPATPPAVKPIFGVALLINNKPVTITAADFDAATGFEFTLPEPVVIGKIADLDSALQPFGITFPDVSTFPAPLNTIATAIVNIQFGVEQLHVKIPGSAKPDDPKLFTFEMSATLATPFVLFSGLSVVGATFGATNETPPAPEFVALP